MKIQKILSNCSSQQGTFLKLRQGQPMSGARKKEWYCARVSCGQHIWSTVKASTFAFMYVMISFFDCERSSAVLSITSLPFTFLAVFVVTNFETLFAVLQ